MEKIKEYMYRYPNWITVIAIVILCSLYFLCRGDYGVHHTNDTGVERLQSGLERTDERLSDAQSQLDDAQSELNGAGEEIDGIENAVSGLGESVSESTELINASSKLIDASEERDRRVQGRIECIESRN